LESSILNIGAQTPVSFTAFLKAISQFWVRRTRLPLPIPVFFIRFVITVLGSQLSTKFGLERLSSLFDLPPMETASDLKRLGITLRPLTSGMSRSGNDRRYCVALEGHALLRYVLKAKPDIGLVRRYVRSIEQLRGGVALGIPSLMLRSPNLIALIDQPGQISSETSKEFTWRVNAAMVLAEASTQGATRFLGLGKRTGFFMNGLAMSGTLAMEIFWRLARTISKPFYKPKFQCDESIK
jgi:NADH dehydrogenase